MRRDVCFECGHRETWREAWRRRRELKRAMRLRTTVGDDAYFALLVHEAILDEVRPAAISQGVLRWDATGRAFRFEPPEEDG